MPAEIEVMVTLGPWGSSSFNYHPNGLFAYLTNSAPPVVATRVEFSDSM